MIRAEVVDALVAAGCSAEIPPGAVWVAMLGTIFGPEPNRQTEAALEFLSP